MAINARAARITGPVPYMARDGEHHNIPLGPCVIENGEGLRVDVIWGNYGQNSTELPMQALKTAAEAGNLVLLD